MAGRGIWGCHSDQVTTSTWWPEARVLGVRKYGGQSHRKVDRVKHLWLPH